MPTLSPSATAGFSSVGVRDMSSSSGLPGGRDPDKDSLEALVRRMFRNQDDPPPAESIMGNEASRDRQRRHAD